MIINRRFCLVCIVSLPSGFKRLKGKNNSGVTDDQTSFHIAGYILQQQGTPETVGIRRPGCNPVSRLENPFPVIPGQGLQNFHSRDIGKSRIA